MLLILPAKQENLLVLDYWMRLFWSFDSVGEECVDDDKIVVSKVGETSGSQVLFLLSSEKGEIL